MLSVSVTELGMEKRNQQDTVNTPVVEVKLLPESVVTWMLALLVNVAPRAGIRAKKTNARPSARRPHFRSAAWPKACKKFMVRRHLPFALCCYSAIRGNCC